MLLNLHSLNSPEIHNLKSATDPPEDRSPASEHVHCVGVEDGGLLGEGGVVEPLVE
jgi:hypothetical protein